MRIAATARRTNASGEARPAAPESGGWVALVDGVELVDEEDDVLVLEAVVEVLFEWELTLALADEESVV